MTYSTPVASRGGPLRVNSVYNFNGIAPGGTYLPIVTWKDTLNTSANNGGSVSEQQLSVAAHLTR